MADEEVQDSAKVIELSKANRKLTLQLEAEKESRQMAESEVDELTAQLAAANRQIKAAAASGDAPAEPSSPSKLPANKDKIANARLLKRAGGLESQVTKLKLEAGKLRVALNKELGDDQWTVAKILDEDSNWRGRGTQIALLKVKLKEAQVKAGERELASDDVDVKSKRHLEQMKTGVHEKIALLTDQLAVVTETAAKTKKFNEALSNRVKILEREDAALRAKLKAMVQKATHDDQLIASLKSTGGTPRRSAAEAVLPPPSFGSPLTPQRPLGGLGQSSQFGQPTLVPEISPHVPAPTASNLQMGADLDAANERVAQLEAALHAERSERDASPGDHQLQALANEAKRVEEMAESYRQTNADLSAKLEAASMTEHELRIKLKRAEVQAAGPSAAPPNPRTVEELEHELELTRAEGRQRVDAIKMALAAKEDELRLSRQLLEDNKAAYDSAIKEIVAGVRPQ